MKLGNKANACLNGEWGKHVKREYKKITSGKRRNLGKKIIRDELLLLKE